MTSMTTSHQRWAVVMSRNGGFIDQCVELDFQYPSEGIHRRWDAGTAAFPRSHSPLPNPFLCPLHHCLAQTRRLHADGQILHNSLPALSSTDDGMPVRLHSPAHILP